MVLHWNIIFCRRNIPCAEDAAYGVVRKTAESYFNYTCRYLFGAYKPLKKMRELIALIPVERSQYRLVVCSDNLIINV